MEAKDGNDNSGGGGGEKTKAQLKAERKAMHEARMAEQGVHKEGKFESKAERREKQEAQRKAKEEAKSSNQPSKQTSNQPSKQPSKQTSNQPSKQPSNQPSKQTSKQTSNQPSKQPSNQPSKQTSKQTSNQLSKQTSNQPSNQPSKLTSNQPSKQTSKQVSKQPSNQAQKQKNKENHVSTEDQVTFFKHLYIPKHFAISDISHMRFTNTCLQDTLTCNDRVMGLVRAIEQLLTDYVTPPRTDLLRDFPKVLKKHVEHLSNVKPLCIATINFLSHFNRYLPTHGPLMANSPVAKGDEELKSELLKYMGDYVKENLHTAEEGIVAGLVGHIHHRDVIMVFSYSRLLLKALERSAKEGVEVEVVVVDARPKLHGTLMVERLREAGISCTYALVSAVPFYIRQTSKVMIEADSVFSNGSVLSRVGASLVCLHARLHVLPVLVVCPSYKLSEACHTDSIVYNQLGDPEELNNNSSSASNPTPDTPTSSTHPARLNVLYDVIPHDLVDLVITEKGTLPSSSVSGIVRMKWN